MVIFIDLSIDLYILIYYIYYINDFHSILLNISSKSFYNFVIVGESLL